MEDIRKFNSVLYKAQKMNNKHKKYTKQMHVNLKETGLQERNNIFYSLFKKDEVVVEIAGVSIKTKRLAAIKNDRYVASVNAHQYEQITGKTTDEKESRLIIFNDCSILLTNATDGDIWIGTEFVNKIRNIGDEICNVCKHYDTSENLCTCEGCRYEATDAFKDELLTLEKQKNENRLEILLDDVAETLRVYGATDNDSVTYRRIFRDIFYSK